MAENPVLAVIGGSGLYEMAALKQYETLDFETPFGMPSAPIVVGILSGKPVAFLARHGVGHHINPTEVNYRANIFALRTIGAEQILSISACGSLRDDYSPGQIVIPDQIFDFTKDRKRSFFDEGLVAHISVANPFCQRLSSRLLQAVESAGGKVHPTGTLITIEGPRFSTRAESNLFRAWGMAIIGMTACPEAFLAREAEMCYATMAHVTDYDVWHKDEVPVSVNMVISTLLKNTELAQNAIEILLADYSTERDCACSSTLRDAIITHKEAITPKTKKKLSVLVEKYLKT